jgi:hypothetical protein
MGLSMEQIHKKALFLALLSGNLLLTPTDGFALDKYHQKTLDDNYLHPASLLNSKVESLYLSSRWQWTQPLFNCFKTRKCLPRRYPRPSAPKPPRIHPQPQKPPVRPQNQELFHVYPVNPVQLNTVVNDAMFKAKQKTDARKLLSNMSEINGLFLQKHLEDDITRTARIQLTRRITVYDLRKKVKTLADQGYQDAGELYYPAEDAASQVFVSRYKERNGVFTNQDRKDAQLHAQQAIQKRRQDKKVILIVSGATTITIAEIAVDSAEKQVKANAGKDLQTLQRRKKYPVNRFPKTLVNP